jgi:hypothetical protein
MTLAQLWPRLTVTKQVIRYRRCHRYFAKNAPSSIGMRPNYTLRNDYLGHDVLQFLISKQIRPTVQILIIIIWQTYWSLNLIQAYYLKKMEKIDCIGVPTNHVKSLVLVTVLVSSFQILLHKITKWNAGFTYVTVFTLPKNHLNILI